MLNDFLMIIGEGEPCDSEILTKYENVVLSHMSYTAPYETFNELRRIQLAVRKHNIYDDEGITLAINITEWIAHEREEYFVSALKFFHDMRIKWKYVFLITGSDANEKIYDMYICIRCYLNGEISVDNKWLCIDNMANYLNQTQGFEKEAAGIFAHIICEKTFTNYRSNVFLKTVADDIRAFTGRYRIWIKDIIQYINMPSSLLSLLMNNEQKKAVIELIAEKGEEYV